MALPKLVQREQQYDATALSEQISGIVLMQAVVGADGRIGSIYVLRSLDPRLDRKAADALAKWRFTPGTYMGVPAPTIVTIELTFTIRK